MSGLAVPQQQQTLGKTISRSGSTSSLRPQIEHEDDLIPMSRSRRNSESNAGAGATPASAPSAGAPGSAAAYAGLVPLPQGPVQHAAENEALTSRVDWSEQDHLKAADAQHAVTTLYVGKNQKPFHVPMSTLVEKSPYFMRTLPSDPSTATLEQTSFEDIDEFAMGLFLHWIQAQGHLQGPHDFHSLAHYLSLYVLAKKFEIEGLENQVMDSVRHYYAEQNMTAPAYRLEYTYHYTQGPNHMRHFLVSTAAFRCLEETPHPDLAAASPMLHQTFYAAGSNVSDSIKAVLAKNPEMAIDFIEELVKLKRNGEHDARHGADCDWHVHEHTAKCKAERREPWQSDGPADESPKPAGTPKPAEPPKPAEAPKPAAPAPPPSASPAPCPPAAPAPPKPAAPGGPFAPTESKKPEAPKPAASAPAAPAPPKPVEPPKPAAPKPAEPHKYGWGDKIKGHFDKLHKKDAPKPHKPADKPAEPPAPKK